MSEEVPSELKELEKFHGHLGPYAIIGYKMGVFARKKLGEGKMFVTVYTGLKKPLSCIIDGIQVATNCTMGKGRLDVREGDIPKASFRVGERRFMLWLNDEYWGKIKSETVPEKELEHAIRYFKIAEEELFEYGDVMDVV